MCILTYPEIKYIQLIIPICPNSRVTFPTCSFEVNESTSKTSKVTFTLSGLKNNGHECVSFQIGFKSFAISLVLQKNSFPVFGSLKDTKQTVICYILFF